MEDKDLIKEEVLELAAEPITEDLDINFIGSEAEVDPMTASEPQPRRFPYSDFMLKCSCGNIVTLQEGIQEGVMHYDIPTMEGSALSLQCPSCLNSLSLYFEERDAPLEEAIEEAIPDVTPDMECNEPDKEVENEQVPQEGKVQE